VCALFVGQARCKHVCDKRVKTRTEKKRKEGMGRAHDLCSRNDDDDLRRARRRADSVDTPTDD
jgi:hypothetical protein